MQDPAIEGVPEDGLQEPAAEVMLPWERDVAEQAAAHVREDPGGSDAFPGVDPEALVGTPRGSLDFDPGEDGQLSPAAAAALGPDIVRHLAWERTLAH